MNVFICSAGRGKVLMCDNFQFHRQKTTATKFYWKCSHHGCPSTLHTNVGNMNDNDFVIEVLKDPNDHNHVPEMENINRKLFVNELQQRIITDPTETPFGIYTNTVVNSEQREQDMPTFNSVQSIIKRKRNRVLPSIPHDVEDLEIPIQFSRTVNNARFKYYQNNDWGILMFASAGNINALLTCNVLMVDGTFKTCPSPYAQFFTIHGNCNGHIIPLIFILLRDKTAAVYSKVFRVLKRKTGNRLNPVKFISDFETGLLAALEMEFPNAIRHCCLFHLTSNIWKYVQQIGLSGDYMNDINVKNIVRKLMALPFLPLALIRNSFISLHDSNEARALRRQYPALRGLFVYLYNNYITDHAQFPPILWNVYNLRDGLRSNNHKESWHSKWNHFVHAKHPNIWIFIKKLVKMQRVVDVQINSAIRGDPVPTRRPKWRRMERNIKRLTKEYRRGTRNLDSYWNTMCYVIHNFV